VTTSIRVNPGICGFAATVSAEKAGKRLVRLNITSDCLQVQKLAGQLGEIDMAALFKPAASSPVYASAAACLLHPPCAVPLAIIKAVECEMGLALPKNVTLEFEK